MSIVESTDDSEEGKMVEDCESVEERDCAVVDVLGERNCRLGSCGR